jgi:hypothetical protein
MARGCGNYIKFYAKNPEHISMLILYENGRKEKIVGRALVWKLDEPEDRIFMDRVYTVHEYQVSLFTDYAMSKGWLFKSTQKYGDEPIIDPKSPNRYIHIPMLVNDIKLNDEYPYMDTLRYLDQDKNRLSTERISDIKLIDTNGQAYDCEWSDRYNRWINMNHIDGDEYVLCQIGIRNKWADDIDNVYRKDEAIYIDYYHEWMPKDKYDELIVHTTIGPQYEILRTDAVYLKHYGGWASNDSVRRNMIYSKFEDDSYYKDDAVFSKIMNSYIFKDESIKVYTDITKEETDYISDKEADKLAYTVKGDYILKK